MFRKAVDIDHGMAVARARVAQSLQLEWLMLGGNDPHLLHRAKAEAVWEEFCDNDGELSLEADDL